jgi:hypothetical protein
MGKRFFLFSKPSRPTLKLTQAPIQSVAAFFPRGKAGGGGEGESDRSPPSNGDVDNVWRHNFTPSVCHVALTGASFIYTKFMFPRLSYLIITD